MHKCLDEINLVYNGQKLGIHVDLNDKAFQYYPIFLDHEIYLKITCLSLSTTSCIDLNNFPKLETFYGLKCKILTPAWRALILWEGLSAHYRIIW